MLDLVKLQRGASESLSNQISCPIWLLFRTVVPLSLGGRGEGQLQHQLLLPGFIEKDWPQVAVVLNAELLVWFYQWMPLEILRNMNDKWEGVRFFLILFHFLKKTARLYKTTSSARNFSALLNNASSLHCPFLVLSFWKYFIFTLYVSYPCHVPVALGSFNKSANRMEILMFPLDYCLSKAVAAVANIHIQIHFACF